jgi:pentatricopeptide repeat protein
MWRVSRVLPAARARLNSSLGSPPLDKKRISHLSESSSLTGVVTVAAISPSPPPPSPAPRINHSDSRSSHRPDSINATTGSISSSTGDSTSTGDAHIPWLPTGARGPRLDRAQAAWARAVHARIGAALRKHEATSAATATVDDDARTANYANCASAIEQIFILCLSATATSAPAATGTLSLDSSSIDHDLHPVRLPTHVLDALLRYVLRLEVVAAAAAAAHRSRRRGVMQAAVRMLMLRWWDADRSTARALALWRHVNATETSTAASATQISHSGDGAAPSSSPSPSSACGPHFVRNTALLNAGMQVLIAADDENIGEDFDFDANGGRLGGGLSASGGGRSSGAGRGQRRYQQEIEAMFELARARLAEEASSSPSSSSSSSSSFTSPVSSSSSHTPCVADGATFNIFMRYCLRQNRASEARALLNEMRERGLAFAAQSFEPLIVMHCERGELMSALMLLDQVRHAVL